MAEDGLVEVKAKISGVFFRAANPEAEPFVEVGSQVRKGHTLALLESMKLYSKIKSPVAGEVVAVHGTNGATVVVGQALFSIRPSP